MVILCSFTPVLVLVYAQSWAVAVAIGGGTAICASLLPRPIRQLSPHRLPCVAGAALLVLAGFRCGGVVLGMRCIFVSALFYTQSTLVMAELLLIESSCAPPYLPFPYPSLTLPLPPSLTLFPSLTLPLPFPFPFSYPYPYPSLTLTFRTTPAQCHCPSPSASAPSRASSSSAPSWSASALTTARGGSTALVSSPSPSCYSRR